MEQVLVFLAFLAVATALGVAAWAWTSRTSVSALAEEVRTKSRMDVLTRQTAQAMRDAVRRR